MKQICVNCDKVFYPTKNNYVGYPQSYSGYFNNDENRWISLDTKHSIRKILHRRMISNPIFKDVDIKLGGETSFDIYPKGWDKTYCLKNFKNSDFE